MLAVGCMEHPLDDRFECGNERGCWTLEYLVEGCTVVETSGQEYSCRAPSILLAPPHTSYTVSWRGEHGRWIEIYAIFDPPSHWNTWLVSPARLQHASVLDLPNSPLVTEMETALRFAVDVQRSPRSNREFLSFNALERALLVFDEINPLHGGAPRDERVDKILWHVANHYPEAISLEELAKLAFLSPSRFSHLFKDQMGQTPMRYLEEYRLHRAAEKLLSTHDSVEQVADAVGFNNAFHFSTRFRKCFGQSPSRFRINPKKRVDNLPGGI